MAGHKYRVGQAVDFTPPSRSVVPASSRAYKILRLLPYERGERMYRIKSITEPYERIADERDLVLSTTL